MDSDRRHSCRTVWRLHFSTIATERWRPREGVRSSVTLVSSLVFCQHNLVNLHVSADVCWAGSVRQEQQPFKLSTVLSMYVASLMSHKHGHSLYIAVNIIGCSHSYACDFRCVVSSKIRNDGLVCMYFALVMKLAAMIVSRMTCNWMFKPCSSL